MAYRLSSLRTALSAVLLTCVALIAAPYAIEAQTRDLAFVHGLGETGSFWSVMRSSLASRLQIQSVANDFYSGSAYEDQANELASDALGLSSAVVVGHSNGGVAGRRYVIANGAPHANGVITIGSPHRGARLALAARNGFIDSWFSYVGNSLLAAPTLYYFIDPDFGYNNSYAMGLIDVLSYGFGAMGSYMGAIGYGYNYSNAAPVFPQMVPNSIFQSQQNNPSSLAIEASRAQTRVGLSTELPQNGQPYTLMLSNPSLALELQYGLEAYAFDMYMYYAFHEDPLLQANAGLWMNMLEALMYIQADWADLQGSITSFSSPLDFSSASNDGVVLRSSSEYPGGVSQLMSYGQYGAIGHLIQTSHPAVVQRVSDLLESEFNVPPWPTPPPVPPNPITVNGALSIRPGQACLYVAGAATGSGPYTFEWYVDGTYIGIGESMYVTIGSSSAFISVVAYDGSGLIGSGGMTVSPNSEAPECYVQ